MALATPLRARHGIMLGGVECQETPKSHYLQGAHLVQSDPQEYTSTSLSAILVRKSGLGDGWISLPYALI